MKTVPLWTVPLIFQLASTAVAAGPAFQFSKKVVAPARQQDELLAVVLDSQVYAATQDGLADVRLINSSGKTVPYFLRKVKTTRPQTVRKTWTARQTSVRPLDDMLEITVRLDQDAPHPNGLRLVTPLRNFEQRVRVSTSADGENWEPVGDETVVFDYSRYMDVRNDSVSFPETPHRHFRIVIDDVTVEQESELLELTRRLRGAGEAERVERVTIDRRPFRVSRIDFWRETEREQVTGNEKREYPVAGLRVEQLPETQQTAVLIQTRREPLTSLELETTARNFSRHAVVQIEVQQGVTSTWREIGEATLSRIDFKKLKREQLTISFPETRQSQYRLLIENRDSPPLDVTGAGAQGNVYQLVLMAVPDEQYRLVYGAEEIEAARYDTQAIQELLGEGFDPVRATLGKQKTQEGRTRLFQWNAVLNHPLALGGVIVLLVIVLGWGLYRAVKRMDQLPDE